MTTTILDFIDSTETSEPQIWDYISPSRLNLWLRCPLSFKKRYIDGIQSPSTPSLFVGKVVHAVLESCYQCSMAGIAVAEKNIVPFVEDAWKQAKQNELCSFDDDAHEAKYHNQVADLVRTYLSETDIATEKPIVIEKRYELPLIDPATGEDFGINLLGIIDLILEDENGLTIIDFKTAAPTSNCEMTHELQLTAYSYIIRQVFGNNESALEIRQLVKTKTPKVVVHRYPPRTDEHFERFFNIVREYLDGLDRGVYNFRPSWNCASCEHFASCAR